MKVYKFIFVIGVLNLVISFMGVTFVYKQYAIIALACFTISYALILRTIMKEREYFKTTQSSAESVSTSTPPISPSPKEAKKIEEVVEMKENELIINSKINPPKRSVRKKVLSRLEPHHD